MLQQTLHDIIEQIYMESMGNQDKFKQLLHDQLYGINTYLTYNKRQVCARSFSTNETEVKHN